MLSSQRLRVLHQLKQRGTLTRVADALSYSTSAISQQLSQLEVEAGVPLLEAAGRGVRLTPQGELLAQHAGRILRAIDEAEADLSSSIDDVRGIVRVATFQTAALTLMPTAMSILAATHPRLTIRFATVQPDLAISALSTHDYDVILGEEYFGQEVPRDVAVEQTDLVLDQMRAYLPTAWGLSPRGLADLAVAPWVMEPVGKPARAWAQGLCRRLGFEPDVRFESDDLLVHLQLVSTGHAVAMLPDLLRPMIPPSLQVIDIAGSPTRRVFTAVRRGGYRRPGVARLRDALGSSLTGHSSPPSDGTEARDRALHGRRQRENNG